MNELLASISSNIRAISVDVHPKLVIVTSLDDKDQATTQAMPPESFHELIRHIELSGFRVNSDFSRVRDQGVGFFYFFR